jgi:hypothetical protein
MANLLRLCLVAFILILGANTLASALSLAKTLDRVTAEKVAQLDDHLAN